MTIIGISGKKQSGKDTVASYIRDKYPDRYIRIAFADALKEEVAKACNTDLATIEKEKELYRPILQWWGTEFRRQQHKAYWIARWLTKVKLESDNALIVCADVRFLNEANTIAWVGGYLWRVNRYIPRQSFEDIDEHSSETALDGYNKFDVLIKNDTNLTALKLETEKILNLLKI